MPKKRSYSRTVNKMIKKSDVVVEVIDARFPMLSRNRHYEKKVTRDPKKKLLVVMNKVDLVPDHIVNKWRNLIKNEGFTVLTTSATKRLSTAVLKRTIIREAGDEYFYITACFIGQPNTGKSSLMNVLKGRSSAPVAPIPGYTKAEQILRITTRLRIFDTPGVIPTTLPMIEQILLGVKRHEQLDDALKAAWALVNKIDEINPDVLTKTYEIKYEDPVDFMRKFAKKRHRLKKGGKLDVDTAATIFLNEHIQGEIPIWSDPDKYLEELKKEQEIIG